VARNVVRRDTYRVWRGDPRGTHYFENVVVIGSISLIVKWIFM